MTLKSRLARLELHLRPSEEWEEWVEPSMERIVAEFRHVLGLREDEPLPPPPEHVDPEAMRALKAQIRERLAQCREVREWKRVQGRLLVRRVR